MGKKCGISKPLGNEKERNTDLLWTASMLPHEQKSKTCYMEDSRHETPCHLIPFIWIFQKRQIICRDRKWISDCPGLGWEKRNFFFFAVLWFELRASHLLPRTLPLEPLCQPFIVLGSFVIVLQTICLGWPGTVFLLISAS
jgi:hypothetical protein